MSNSQNFSHTHESSTTSSEFYNVEEINNIWKRRDLSNANDDLDSGEVLDALGQWGDPEETADRLDYSYNKLINDMQHKFLLLESLQKQNEEMEKLKNMTTVNTNITKSHTLEQLMVARQHELLELLDLQIEELEMFEKDVRNIAGKFPKESKDSETKSLMEQVERLRVNIAKKRSELEKCKEGIWTGFENKSMEESIMIINLLNEKLTKSVEQMTTETNKVRSEVNNFNFVRATASSMLLSMVGARGKN